jgi:hypothetical protein
MPRQRSFVRSTPFVLAAAFAASCGGPSAPMEQSGGAVLIEERRADMAVRGSLELRTLAIKTAADATPPSEPYVEGYWVGGVFDATGDVVGPKGSAPRGRTLTRGRLELRTRSFFRADDSRPKTPPWIEGWRDDDTGGFHPLGGVLWRDG